MANVLKALGEAVGIHTRASLGIDVDGQPYVQDGYTPPLPGVIPSARASVGITLDSAATIPAVWRAINILTTAVGQLEMDVYRGTEIIDRPALIKQPDTDQTLSQFLKRTMVGLAGCGNAYWRILRNDTKAVIGLKVLDPLAVSIEYDRGRKFYRYGQQRFSADEIKHLRLQEFPGHDEGLGPIQACRAALRGTLDLRGYSDEWFQKGSIPNGILSTDQPLTPLEAEAIKARWNESQVEHGVAVLGKGVDYQPVLIKPADAQFLENKAFSVLEVAQMFGIPAPMLLAAVQGNSMTYTNTEMIGVEFVRYTLMAYLTEIQDALSSLLVRGQSARFNLDAFLKPDAKSQAEVYEKYLNLGVLSTAEVRTKLGVPGPPPAKPKPVVVAPQATPPDQEAPTP